MLSFGTIAACYGVPQPRIRVVYAEISSDRMYMVKQLVRRGAKALSESLMTGPSFVARNHVITSDSVGRFHNTIGRLVHPITDRYLMYPLDVFSSQAIARASDPELDLG